MAVMDFTWVWPSQAMPLRELGLACGSNLTMWGYSSEILLSRQ